MNKSKKFKIAIVDTMFSRINMGEIALGELNRYVREKNIQNIIHERKTVPGIKDLAVVCKQMLAKDCDIAIALGMVGGAPIDKQCAHEASLGIQMAKMLTNKQIIEVFVHENEAWSEKEFVQIAENRIKKHVQNAVDILVDEKSLTQRAGMGIRQGKDDEGTIRLNANKNETKYVGIVASTFHRQIDSMIETSVDILEKNNTKYTIAKVPGAFDTPLMVKKMLMDKRIQGVIVLGAIEKGETHHGDVIGNSTAKTLQELSLQFNKPVTLGIIGPGANKYQIEKRAIKQSKWAAESMIKLVYLIQKELL